MSVRPSRRGAPRAVALVTALAALALPTSATASVVEPVDCVGPVVDAEPGTDAWTQRDTENIWCAEQRLRDAAFARVHDPAVPRPLRDTYRDPSDHVGTRFRFAEAVPLNRAGAELPTDVFAPCTPDACPDAAPEVFVGEGPYPVVFIVHGGASARQHLWWAAETLAESGYVTVAFDVAETSGGDHMPDTQDIVEWALSDAFPFAGEIDPDRLGIAGHSQGASTASLLGQMDDRIKAIVAWDNLTVVTDPELWADDLGVDPPADLVITTPALGIGADYSFTPKPATDRPEPAPSNGEGGRGRGVSTHPKHLGFAEVSGAGVDSMLFILRAATHLDFVPFTEQASSRYGEAVSAYLTLAWFDRYLKGLDDPALAADAHRRLIGSTTFDASGDEHNIGSGITDPIAGNTPYRIEGLSMCDRMSFYFASRIAVHAPATAEQPSPPLLSSQNLRPDCQAVAGPYVGEPSTSGDPTATATVGAADPAATATADVAAADAAAAPTPLAATGGGATLLAVLLLLTAVLLPARRRTT